ncbi:MAG: hypothetical protein QXM92_01615 [Candidatus Anstonellales archaeon]
MSGGSMKKTEVELCLFSILVTDTTLQMYKILDECMLIIFEEVNRLKTSNSSNMDFLMKKFERLEAYARTLSGALGILTSILDEFREEENLDNIKN